jgi:hypothetical protein
MRASEALRTAAIVVSQGWARHVREEGGAYRVLGALIVACADDWDLYWRASRALAEVIPLVPGTLLPLARCITCWNDSLDPAKGQQEVMNALDRAACFALSTGD